MRYSVEEVQAAIAGREPDAVGGSAVVYRTVLRRQPVAVKVVTLAGVPDSYRALLAGEIDLLASMGRHPNIVQLRGCVPRDHPVCTCALPEPLCCRGVGVHVQRVRLCLVCLHADHGAGTCGGPAGGAVLPCCAYCGCSWTTLS